MLVALQSVRWAVQAMEIDDGASDFLTDLQLQGYDSIWLIPAVLDEVIALKMRLEFSKKESAVGGLCQ